VAELEKLSAKDPLPEYEHGPFQIINDGLLWDSAQSKCSVGSDQGLRAKVSDLATAWQEGDAAKVRSLVADIKGSVPAATPSAPKVHHHSKKPAAKTEKPGNA
ncbi:MAG TPA: hypothetical protein VJX67_15830, partial [Blastocatellia bacterium]|nr:hypothetical protein [Blastocatellia bacterium]